MGLPSEANFLSMHSSGELLLHLHWHTAGDTGIQYHGELYDHLTGSVLFIVDDMQRGL